MRSTLKKSQLPSGFENQTKNIQPRHVQRQVVVDDYIRNFLTLNGFSKTLDSFQVWLSISRKSGTNVSNRSRMYPMLKFKTKF